MSKKKDIQNSNICRIGQFRIISRRAKVELASCLRELVKVGAGLAENQSVGHKTCEFGRHDVFSAN